MSLKIIVTTLFIICFATCIQELRTVDLLSNQIRDWTPSQCARWIADLQPEVFKKAVLHYLNNRIQTLSTTLSSTAIKQQLRRWFSIEGVQKISRQISIFMQERLKQKLQIQKLQSNSLKNQISEHPQNYFLTFDMYDLLIDDELRIY